MDYVFSLMENFGKQVKGIEYLHESYGDSFYIGSKIFNFVDNNVLVFGVTFKKWENELKYIGTKLLYIEFTINI